MKKSIRKTISLMLSALLCLSFFMTSAKAAESLSSYLKRCSFSETNQHVKLTANVTVRTYPCTAAINSSSTKVADLTKDTRVIVKKSITNPENSSSTITRWMEIEFTLSGSTKTGYIPAFQSGNSGTMNAKHCFLEDCTKTNSHVTLKTTKSTYIKTLPCSASSDSASEDVVNVPSGATMTGTELLKYKDYSTYWYKVEYTSGGTKYTGYSYAGDSTATPKYSVSVSNVKAPTGTREVGAALTLEGNITSSVLPLSKVGAFVYSGSATSGSALTGAWASTTAKSYSIKGSAVDNNCKIGSLPQGTYTYTIKAQVKNTWTTSGNAITSETKELLLHSNSFSEGVTYYTVSYNANGGYGAPAAQTKQHNKTLTLTTDKPVRNNETVASYTVYLNANGGSVSTSALTANRTTYYFFSNWNTNSSGTGTSYNPGSSYTNNANVTLYAQWTGSTSTDSVYLPTPTRSGFTFKGWGTSTSSTSGYTGNYTPSNNITLYAIWQANGPVITTQPKSVTVIAGKSYSISVKATGTGLKYTWYYQSPGAASFTKSSVTSSTYSNTARATGNGMKFYVIVTDTYGNNVRSNTVTLTVPAAPKITTQPASNTVGEGKSYSFSVKATGTGLKYAWYYLSPGASSYTKSSVTSSTYSNTARLTGNGMKFYCVVTDNYGQTVKSNVATLTVAAKPKITQQPKSVLVAAGSKYSFTVKASGTGLKYAWYYRSASATSFTKSSVTSSTYTNTAKAVTDGLQMYCIVTDAYGNAVKSNVVTVAIK